MSGFLIQNPTPTISNICIITLMRKKNRLLFTCCSNFWCRLFTAAIVLFFNLCYWYLHKVLFIFKKKKLKITFLSLFLLLHTTRSKHNFVPSFATIILKFALLYGIFLCCVLCDDEIVQRTRITTKNRYAAVDE